MKICFYINQLYISPDKSDDELGYFHQSNHQEVQAEKQISLFVQSYCFQSLWKIINRMLILIFLFAIAILSHSQSLYDPNSVAPGPNLISNPAFAEPVVPAGTASAVYHGSISGWTCASECQVTNIPETCLQVGVTCSATFSKGIDLDTSHHYNEISQVVQIATPGSYLVHVDWLPPFNSPENKYFRIKVNSTVILDVTSSDQIYNTHTSEIVVNASAGELTLGLVQYGSNPNGRGIIIGTVSLQELISISPGSPNSVTTNSSIQNSTEIDLDEDYSQPSQNVPTPEKGYDGSSAGEQEDLISFIMLNNYTRFVNSLPGSRVFTSVLVNFLITFDRLQLYYLHSQNLSYYSNILLSDVYTLELQKGQLPQQLITAHQNTSQLCSSIISTYQTLSVSLNKQYGYSTPFFLTRNQNGNGFFANNLDYLYFTLPSIIVIYLLLHLLFKVSSQFRISKLFRKYSFLGLFLVIVFEGNVEQFTFYFFQDCQNLFSATAVHKLGNVFMIFFFFATVAFSVGGLLWFRITYKKLVKYFIEEYKKVRLYLLALQTLEKSLMPFLFGAVHALLITDLAMQSLALGAVQVLYLGTKVVYLRARPVAFKFKIVMLSLTSLLRMVFIPTLYLFEREGHPPIINEIHELAVWTYLICWILESLYDLCLFLSDLVKIIKKSCLGSKQNYKQMGKDKELAGQKKINVSQMEETIVMGKSKLSAFAKCKPKKILSRVKGNKVTFWEERHRNHLKNAQPLQSSQAKPLNQAKTKTIRLIIQGREIAPQNFHEAVASALRDEGRKR